MEDLPVGQLVGAGVHGGKRCLVLLLVPPGKKWTMP